MSDVADEALMVRYRAGEVRAFDLLLARYRRPIYNYILRYTHDPALAEDLLQETFLRVVKASATYEQQARFSTWLYTIARNLCVDASRRAKHRKVASLDAPLDDGDGSATLLDVMADKKGQVDRAVIGKQLAERIQEAVAALVEEQREVFLMREVLNLSFKEIGDVVGVSENTVKSRMRYALEKLRDALDEYRDLAQVAQ